MPPPRERSLSRRESRRLDGVILSLACFQPSFASSNSSRHPQRVPWRNQTKSWLISELLFAKPSARSPLTPYRGKHGEAFYLKIIGSGSRISHRLTRCDRHGTTVSGSELVYPNSQLFHQVSIGETHITVIFSIFPRTRSEPAQSWSIDYNLAEIPWQQVNVAEFRIDATHSNSFAAAQRGRPDPFRPVQSSTTSALPKNLRRNRRSNGTCPFREANSMTF